MRQPAGSRLVAVVVGPPVALLASVLLNERTSIDPWLGISIGALVGGLVTLLTALVYVRPRREAILWGAISLYVSFVVTAVGTVTWFIRYVPLE
jgi:ABC-type uncharacterized transport system permease subunit